MTLQSSATLWTQTDPALFRAPEDLTRLADEERALLVAARDEPIASRLINTPVMIHSSPLLKRQFPFSFFDSNAIYIADDFARRLVDEEARSKGKARGLAPLIAMHTICQAMSHSIALREFPEAVAQVSGEISAFAKMKIRYPELEWADELMMTVGAATLSAAKIRAYHMAHEADIAWDILGEAGLSRGQDPLAIQPEAIAEAFDHFGIHWARVGPCVCCDDRFVARALIHEAEVKEIAGVMAAPSDAPSPPLRRAL